MSSPSPSPPYRGMERLSLHRSRRRPTPYSLERRVASSVPRDRPLSPPAPPPSGASLVIRGLGTPTPQPQREQESAADSPPVIDISKPSSRTSPPRLPPSMNLNLQDVPRDPPGTIIVGCGAHAQEESESGSELDSPPHISFVPRPKYEGPSSPTSPSGSPTSPHVSRKTPYGSLPLVDMNPAGSPKYSSSDEEDAYFKSMVDNFVTVAANTFIYTSSDDDIDYKAADQRHSVMYAEHALKHYNNDEKNEVKYKLISGITSCDMLVREGCFGHVNFTAKGNRQNSKEELFFAELRWDGDTPVPTCVVSLEGMKYTDSRYDKFYVDVLPMDGQNCYACRRQLKHPKNGELYEMGHVATSDFYEL